MEEVSANSVLFDNEDNQMTYNTLTEALSLQGMLWMDWEFPLHKGLHLYDPLHKGVKFRLGGMEREMHLLEFGWRVGLYSERESREVATLSGLRNADFKDQACSSLPHNDHHGKEGNHPTKTSLIKMGVIMELHEGECCWPATREVTGEGGGDDEEGDGEGGNEVIGGSRDIYRNISQGEWQVHQA
ncbi:hypothetical protein Tco_0939835 [Tanacetum coccineum]|uniref:Uncharacterized protein n=1 Tax=Tanacetum coccineum TaxID=301880 RepID=A0ABQ5DLR6_9ASTR